MNTWWLDFYVHIARPRLGDDDLGLLSFVRRTARGAEVTGTNVAPMRFTARAVARQTLGAADELDQRRCTFVG